MKLTRCLFIILFLFASMLYAESTEPNLIRERELKFFNGLVIDLSEQSTFYGRIINDEVVQTSYEVVWDELSQIAIVTEKMTVSNHLACQYYFYSYEGEQLGKTDVYSSDRDIIIFPDSMKIISIPIDMEYEISTCFIIDYSGDEVSAFNRPKNYKFYQVADDDKLIFFYRHWPYQAECGKVDLVFVSIFDKNGVFIDNLFTTKFEDLKYRYNKQEYTIPIASDIKIWGR